MKYTNNNGLLADASTSPPTACGYIFNFEGHGAFVPGGKIGDLTQAEVDNHNKALAEAMWQAMLKHGKGILYITQKDGSHHVSDWPAVHRVEVGFSRKSWHNMTGHNGRTDVWFTLDKSLWHGVNIGDNQILRVKRTKTK